MLLGNLLQDIPIKLLKGSLDVEVNGVSQDSRKVAAGNIFVAIQGSKFNGHDTLAEVVWKKPAAIIVEQSDAVPAEFRGTALQVDSSRQALDHIAHGFYGFPSHEMVCIGVTGTNGKTTTTHMIEKIMSDQGLLTGVIGTINHHLGKKVWPTSLTTPGSIELYQRLREFATAGAKGLAIEVSSHALAQYRGDAITFDAAIFTNLTRDHLDYHSTMEEYFATKTKLFTNLLAGSESKRKTAVINTDDSYGRQLLELYQGRTVTFGQANAHLTFQILKEGFSGTEIELMSVKGIQNFKLPIPCRYNVYNAVGAIAAALAVDLDVIEAIQSLTTFQGVKGRLERVPNAAGLNVFVDFAHSDQALMNVLDSLRALRAKQKEDSKIITVFGCGGDRDKGKRPLMAKAAMAGSDFVIVTSDNPRTENPQDIIDDILSGVPPGAVGKTVLTEVQRRVAIEKALNMAQKGDVVLIAGKGHEDYQIIGDKKIPFSDVETVRELLT